jgi:hypothetical protein
MRDGGHTAEARCFLLSVGMTAARLIPLTLRSGLMMLLGAAVLTLPAALSLGPAAIVAGVAAGALAVGLGIAGTASEGRGTLPSVAHAAYDRGLTLGLLVAAVVLGAAGDKGALALFGAAAIVTLAITVTTRYSAVPD